MLQDQKKSKSKHIRLLLPKIFFDCTCLSCNCYFCTICFLPQKPKPMTYLLIVYLEAAFPHALFYSRKDSYKCDRCLHCWIYQFPLFKAFEHFSSVMLYLCCWQYHAFCVLSDFVCLPWLLLLIANCVLCSGMGSYSL